MTMFPHTSHCCLRDEHIPLVFELITLANAGVGEGKEKRTPDF